MGTIAALGQTAAVGALTLFLCLPAAAVSTSFWRVDSYEGFTEGDAASVSVLEEGALALGPDSERTEVPDAGYVWAAAPGPRGATYLAAGTPGRLYRLDGDELTLLFEETTADLPALAVAPDGDVFVGTAPGGQVYRISPGGEATLFFDTGQGYVWSMAYSEEHGLLVGTGASAKVYLVDTDGSGEVLYESAESSITAIAGSGRTVLAGTSGEGLLLDITPGSPPAVLFDSDFEEISAIVPGVRGETYFASTRVSLEDALDRTGDEDSSFGEGQVWRTTPAGGAVGLWESSDAPVTSLGLGPGGTVWAGTGATGLIVSIGSRGRSDLIADLEEEEVLSIAGTGEGVLATTGVQGALYRFGPGVAPVGSYESDVLSGVATARWGEMRWRGETPGGSSVTFSTRSGNSDEPDETWSEWARVEPRGGSEGPVASPPAQHLQWRVELTRGSDGASPVVRAVEVAYLPENLPPRLVSVTVSPPGEGEPPQGASAGKGGTQTMPGWLAEALGAEPPSVKARDLPAVLRGIRSAEWETVDPNDDDLIFDVWLKSESEERWKVMERGLTATTHAWDTQSMSDGIYRLKIVATDEPDNPRETAGRDSIVSAPFLVDGTPPVIEALDLAVRSGRVAVEGAARDAGSPIDRVDVAVDYGEWKAAFPGDGMFDSPTESFRLDAGAVAAGEHALAVRVSDTAGNSAVETRIVR